MSVADRSSAETLFQAGDLENAAVALEREMQERPGDPELLFLFGRLLTVAGRCSDAATVLQQCLAAAPDHARALAALAYARKRIGTHKDIATARDLYLSLMAKQAVPVALLREAAESCSWVGPIDKAVELWRMVVAHEPTAPDHFHFSEALASADRLDEAAEQLKLAIALDPQRYAKSKQDIAIVDSAVAEKGKNAPLKKGRYPTTEEIQNDFENTILKYVAADLSGAAKFIHPNTSFFTMGSCFARNVVRALMKSGYNASHMEISEYINSTYANKYFVDWLKGDLNNPQISERIEELLPQGFSKDSLIEKISSCDVFIVTLGVAPAFFDRETGEFVLPRPTALNSRALAEKYKFRTTTVAENVDNVLYLLTYVRQMNPRCRIVVTESPVPLQMTFEFQSAVVADCLSKSTLRLAAHALVNECNLPEIYYWPSFEIIRWLGCHTGPVYGTDDGAAWHVSEAMVGTIVQCFIKAFQA